MYLPTYLLSGNGIYSDKQWFEWIYPDYSMNPRITQFWLGFSFKKKTNPGDEEK